MTLFPTTISDAARRLLRRPGYSAVVTLVLALGLGSAIAVYTILDTLVLRPLPLRDPRELVSAWIRPPPDAQWDKETPGLAVIEDWRARATSFAGLAAFIPRDSVWLSPRGPERLPTGRVVGDLFPLLGARMALGRGFSSAETGGATPAEARDAPRANAGTAAPIEPAVLSHAFWRRAFAARGDVLGESIVVDGVARTIVGVLPPEPGLPVLGEETTIYVPWRATDLRSPDDVVMGAAIGRLRAGVTIEAAAAELSAIKRASDLEQGRAARAESVLVRSLQEGRAEDARPTLLALFAGAIVLLIVTCTNVGTLALTQLVERRHELAVRTSLGATPWKLVRQLMTESLLLFMLGGALGVGLAALALEWFARVNPFDATQIGAGAAFAIDGRVLAFAVGVTLAAALAFGLLPAWRASARDPVRTMREDGGGASASVESRRTGRVSVVAQVALSTICVSGAALLALSLVKLTGQPLGFTPDDLVAFRVLLPARDYAEGAKRIRFRDALLERVRALPGVESAATTSAPPLGTINVLPIAFDGPAPAPNEPRWAALQAIGADYFAAAGMRLVAGRAFGAADRADGEPVAIVNETFARRFMPGRDALGQRAKLGNLDGPFPWLRIVGVAADVKHAGLEWEYLPEVFVPYEQLVPPFTTTPVALDLNVIARVPNGRMLSERSLREAVAALDPGLPLMDLRSGRQLVAASAERATFRAVVAGAIALLAALLSSLGLYGVLARTVAQRRRELGVRMALGATPGAMLRAVCASGVALASAGAVLGGVASWLAARLAGETLYGVDGLEAYVIAAVAAAMAAAGLAASLGPARRTARLSPTLAIRDGADR